MKKVKHTIWHHLFMVVYEEIMNLVWVSVGCVLGISGLLVFSIRTEAFFRAAVGLPMLLAGVSVLLFSIYEIVLVLISPSRIRLMCKFCGKN